MLPKCNSKRKSLKYWPILSKLKKEDMSIQKKNVHVEDCDLFKKIS